VLPPRWVRRVVVAPAVPVATLLLLTSLPLTAIGAAFASIWLPGRWRPLRILWFALVFLAVESAMLLWLFTLWVGSGLGQRLGGERWQGAHYHAMDGYLTALVRTAQRTFRLRFDARLDDAGVADDPTGHRPALLVFSRHAGPGDSFLLVHALLQLGYRPRIVLREALRWAPAIDVGLSRVPSYFVRRGAPRGTGRSAVAMLAGGLGQGDALVLFPEGRNFTPHRRLHSIAKLEELGLHDEAEEAREMRYVLTPRSGGALAALEAAPDADVVFVAHTGLEDLSSVVDVWRGIPMDSDIEVQAWRVPRAQIPRVPAAQDAWLQWWWRRIDAWLLERCGEEAIPDAVVEAVIGTEVEPPPG
jgi:1-acyl-sn-glycerol-3-phosphate acyltransferase